MATNPIPVEPKTLPLAAILLKMIASGKSVPSKVRDK